MAPAATRRPSGGAAPHDCTWSNRPDRRRALQVTLSVAPSDATPEQVLADAFASLGYLPDEAKQAGLKLLAKAEDKA
jgi:hypothetical protein